MKVEPKDALSGYFVPFRSPRWRKLPHHIESLNFGASLWRKIFKHMRVKTVLTIGKLIARPIAKVLAAEITRRHQAGWGKQTIDEYRFGEHGVMLVMPHLSTFKLFSRPESLSALRAVLPQVVRAAQS